MGKFNSDDHYIYYCGQESLRRKGVALIVNKRVQNSVLGYNLKNDRMISVHFQGKPFNITVIQVYAPTSNAEEAEVEWFYEDLQDLLELTPKKDVLFIIGDWNAKVGSQDTPGVTGKFGLGVRNEAGQRLIEFCQETTTCYPKLCLCGLRIILRKSRQKRSTENRVEVTPFITEINVYKGTLSIRTGVFFSIKRKRLPSRKEGRHRSQDTYL